MVSMIPHRRSRGSPPRMRGKGQLNHLNLHTPGITPAYAGKSQWTKTLDGSLRDHPRVCGEKPASMPRHALRRGSPPRMRGKDLLVGRQLAAFGITPACAGKRGGAHRKPIAGRDHPRVCGEKGGRLRELVYPLGSPPRMRGKGIADDEARAAVGITPACAGKSELPRFFLRCPWDHPRVCGEKMVSMIPHRRSRGSPPRVRGKEDGFAQLGNVGGITPAYAGKRRCPRFRPGKIRDHPRVCGEKASYK